MSSTKADKKIKNKQILNCELGKYCDSDEMGIIFRKKKKHKTIYNKNCYRKKEKNNNNNNKRFIPRQYPTVQRRLQEKT